MSALWILWAMTAHAGTRLIQVDNFEDNSAAAFQGGFVQGECWAMVYVPEASDYPFTPIGIDALIGGAARTESFLVQVYAADDDMRPVGRWQDEEIFDVGGSDDALNRLSFVEAEMDIATVNSGNVMIAVCLESHDYDPGDNFPAIAADGNRTDFPQQSLIGTYLDGWIPSANYGVTGDWVMRLCIESANIAGNECGDGTTPGDPTGDDTGDPIGDDTGGDPNFYIQSITPSSADSGQAVSVVILGAGFEPGTQALIGGISLSGTTVASDTSISGTTSPTLESGVYDVELRQPDGDVATLPGGFVVAGKCGCASHGAGSGALLGLIGAFIVRKRRGI